MSKSTTPCVDCGKPRHAERSPRCQVCRDLHIKEKRRLWAAVNPDVGIKWRANNHGKVREYKRRWADSNKENQRERSSRWASANPQKVIDKSRLWRARNPEKVRDTQRRRWAEKRDECRKAFRKWCLDNPVKARARTDRRRARKLSAFVANVTASDIARLMAQQRGRCPYCLRSIRDGYHVDHYVPLAKGGTHEPSNVQLLCPACNMSKGAKLPEVFAQERGRLF